MMIDADIVAVSPSSVYRVLKRASLLDGWNRKPSNKEQGFVQSLKPHEHWHIDISYINVCGTFYYLCSVLDKYSRYIVHWEIPESVTEHDVETIIQRARESFPDAQPRIIPACACRTQTGRITARSLWPMTSRNSFVSAA